MSVELIARGQRTDRSDPSDRSHVLTIEHIFISPGHNFFGHHGVPAGQFPTLEVGSAECIAGHGLRGDRFCTDQAGRKGQLTLFSAEIFARLQQELQLPAASPGAMRRNVIVRGADLNALIGIEFELQGVRLAGVEECSPCSWMDEALGPGAKAWLHGRGGLRCRILTSGWLRTGSGKPLLQEGTEERE